MTTVTSLSSDVRAALGTDLSKELQRLEPLKGKLGSRIIQAVQNEVNRFVNIFKTGKFTTDAQVCVLLDKEVAKLEKLMKEEETLMKKQGIDPNLVKQDIKFRESVEALSGKMAEIVHKFAGKNQKPSKELLKFDKNLKKLHEHNHKKIERDKKTLENLEKLTARPKAGVPGRVHLPETVAELGTAKYFFGKQEALVVKEDLEVTLDAVKQKAGSKNLSEKDLSFLRGLSREKFAGMEPEQVRQTLITLVPILQRAMYQERFSDDVESAFERIRTAVKAMPSRVQEEVGTPKTREELVKGRLEAAAAGAKERLEELPEELTEVSRREGRERAAAMMRGIKETGKVPGREEITSKVDVERARNVVINTLPRLVQTLEKNGVKISEHPDETERQLLKEVATGKTLKGKTSEELATVLEDTIAAIHHGYTIADTGPGHVPDDVKRDIEGLKSARQALGAFAKGEVAGREQLAKTVRARGEEAAREVREHRERKVQFGQRVSEFEPVFGGKEERRAKFEAGKKAKREELAAARGQANVEFEAELAKRGKTIRREKSVGEVLGEHPKIQEDKRLREIAQREKTQAQTALSYVISQAYEIGGKPFVNLLGADSEDNKFLEALRDQKPQAFNVGNAKKAIDLVKEGFENYLPDDIEEAITVLEERIKSVDRLRTTPTAKWK